MPLLPTTSAAPSSLTVEASQTDASEWSEYETDMRDLVINLREEGIDIPLDEKGHVLLTPEFLKSLPPKFQTHAGGKEFSKGEPFAAPIVQPKGAKLTREIQTRRSAWEDYLKDLNELYRKLEAQGVRIPRDEDGALVLTESFLKSFPPGKVPHMANDFASIDGVPKLPDGTALTPRLAQQLITPGLEGNLEKLVKYAGMKVPKTKDGLLDLSAQFIRTVPKDILAKVLEPVYDSMEKQAAARKSAIKALNQQQKEALEQALEEHGFKVRLLDESDILIPLPAVIHLKEDLFDILGESRAQSILFPSPKKVSIMPSDVVSHLSSEQKAQIARYLQGEGLSFEVDESDDPVITYELARLLPQDLLENYDIVLPKLDSDRSSVINPAKSRVSINLRRSLGTDKGLLRFAKKCMMGFLTRLLQDADIEIKMKADEVDLSNVPNKMLPVLTEAIQNEIMSMHTDKLLTRLQRLPEKEKDLILIKLEAMGVDTDLPVDEYGNKILSTEFLETFARDVLTLALRKAYGIPGSEDEEEQAIPHSEMQLTDEQKSEFVDKLSKRGIPVPINEFTGRPRFTKYFIAGLPKEIAHAIAKAANAENELHISSSSSEDEEEEEEEESISVAAPSEPVVARHIHRPIEDFRVGLFHGLTIILDKSGEAVEDKEVIDSFFEDAYGEEELQIYAERNREREALIRRIIREWKNTDEKNPELKKADSVVDLQKMAMRYIPRYKMRPDKFDPINLFKHDALRFDPHAPPKSKEPQPHPTPSESQYKEVDFILRTTKSQMLPFGRIDSLATLASTIEKRISNATVRGSLISTHLSDMSATYSQAFLEEPSSVMLLPSTSQHFDISPSSIARFREKWLSDYLSGSWGRNSITIRVFNTISHKRVEIRAHRDHTLNEVCHIYSQYDDHPEYYVWKDLDGKVLDPHKTVVQNGLVGHDEVLEFEGVQKFPTIVLYFRDGFENDKALPIHPIEALQQQTEKGLCRNY